jgi:GNAT superfamily N-acetyltransferase
VVSWREVAVDDLAAQSLLTEYFASRALGFPADQGEYRTVFPDPAQFEPPRGVFLVVEGEDLAGEAADVGCGGIRRLDELDGPVAFEVKHLWLQPQARGIGAGRALLQELERRAVALGAQRLVLDTNESLAAAGGLYRSSGYVEIAPYNDNPNATTWYEKLLPR